MPPFLPLEEKWFFRFILMLLPLKILVRSKFLLEINFTIILLNQQFGGKYCIRNKGSMLNCLKLMKIISETARTKFFFKWWRKINTKKMHLWEHCSLLPPNLRKHIICSPTSLKTIFRINLSLLCKVTTNF